VAVGRKRFYAIIFVSSTKPPATAPGCCQEQYKDARSRIRLEVFMHRTRLGLLAVSAVLVGCTGTVANPDKTPGDGNTTPPAGGNGTHPGAQTPGAMPGTNAPAPAMTSAAEAPLRRLTRNQYLNSVRDLLGVKDAVAVSSLPGDDAIGDRFHSNTVTPLQAIDVGKYSDAADAIAAKAVVNLDALVACDVKAMGEPACARAFITNFGKRGYRRPLTAAEIGLLQTVFTAGGDFPTGIRLVVNAILISPKFLYLPEPVPATAGKIVGVEPWAMASRLSYFLLDTMPDEGLFKAVEAGQLSTPDQIAGQATRLMKDPRFKDTLATFHQEWMQLDTLPGTEKDPMLFPAWNPALRDALGEETRRFVQYVYTEGDGTLDTLLTAPFSFLDGPLYDLYGVPAPAGAAPWGRVDLPRGQRAGLLTQGGLLATLAHDNRTSFILRGKMVREAIFCAKPLVAPPDVPDEPKLDPTASAKARSEQHRTNPSCKTCHELFDPIGFAFEIYDATGKYRTTDSAGPIDSSVTLENTAGLNGKTAANAVDLARLLTGADEVRDCVARQWMRFALGRDDSPDDDPSMLAAAQTFKSSGAKLPDLLMAIARSDSFRYQKVAQ
jgi:hypothetical protein